MLTGRTRYTRSGVSSAHSVRKPFTAELKVPVCAARYAMLIAPADTPVRIGMRSSGNRSATATSTPIWYAARAPPPESTRARCSSVVECSTAFVMPAVRLRSTGRCGGHIRLERKISGSATSVVPAARLGMMSVQFQSWPHSHSIDRSSSAHPTRTVVVRSHLAVELQVLSEVHGRHATLADLLANYIALSQRGLQPIQMLFGHALKMGDSCFVRETPLDDQAEEAR